MALYTHVATAGVSNGCLWYLIEITIRGDRRGLFLYTGGVGYGRIGEQETQVFSTLSHSLHNGNKLSRFLMQKTLEPRERASKLYVKHQHSNPISCGSRFCLVDGAVSSRLVLSSL